MNVLEQKLVSYGELLISKGLGVTLVAHGFVTQNQSAAITQWIVGAVLVLASSFLHSQRIQTLIAKAKSDLQPWVGSPLLAPLENLTESTVTASVSQTKPAQ